MTTRFGVEDLFAALVGRLAQSGYADPHGSEAAFEEEVWDRVVALMRERGADPSLACLTSHTVGHRERTDAGWRAFCADTPGPDVNVLSSNNRLDIVVREPAGGSVGIEVKCLGRSGHCAKLTQGIGQTILALENRDRTLLVIHAGTVSEAERVRLREIAGRVCHETRMAIVVAP